MIFDGLRKKLGVNQGYYNPDYLNKSYYNKKYLTKSR